MSKTSFTFPEHALVIDQTSFNDVPRMRTFEYAPIHDTEELATVYRPETWYSREEKVWVPGKKRMFSQDAMEIIEGVLSWLLVLPGFLMLLAAIAISYNDVKYAQDPAYVADHSARNALIAWAVMWGVWMFLILLAVRLTDEDGKYIVVDNEKGRTN